MANIWIWWDITKFDTLEGVKGGILFASKCYFESSSSSTVRRIVQKVKNTLESDFTMLGVLAENYFSRFPVSTSFCPPNQILNIQISCSRLLGYENSLRYIDILLHNLVKIETKWQWEEEWLHFIVSYVCIFFTKVWNTITYSSCVLRSRTLSFNSRLSMWEDREIRKLTQVKYWIHSWFNTVWFWDTK